PRSFARVRGPWLSSRRDTGWPTGWPLRESRPRNSSRSWRGPPGTDLAVGGGMPPSFVHQGMTKLAAEHPELWPVLLQRALGLELRGGLVVMQGPETVRQLRAPDHTADGTVVLQRICDGTLEEALVSEIQRHPDEDKQWTWPIHVAGVRARLRCSTTLVVLT